MEEELKDKLCKSLDKSIESMIMDDEIIRDEDIENLGELVDMKKDLANIEYWKVKEDTMRYRYGRGSYNEGSYGTYGRRERDSRGRYTEGGSYGRRYRGHDMIDEMGDHYSRYEEGREEYNRGNYGAKEDTVKSLEYMMQSAYDFICMLQDEATSEEEMNVIRKYARKISEL